MTMRKRFYLRALPAVLAVALLAFVSLRAQEKTTPKPRGPADLTPIKQQPPGKILSRQQLAEQTTLAKLGNGLTVIIRERHLAPVATARVYVSNTGSAYEGKYLGAGISHLTEHLVSGGSTKHRSEKQLEELLNSLGGSSNAYTSVDVTAFHIDVPARHIRTAIEVLADAMQNCIFPEKEFNREYHVVQRELEMGEEERSRVLWQMLSQLAYREHPLRHPIVGYLPILQSITRDDVMHYYHERYQPQNMTFVVAGDVATDEVLTAVSAAFDRFPRTAELTIPIPTEPPVTSPRSQARRMEGEMTDLAIAWPTVSLEHPDVYPLDLAAAILGSGDSSRLVRKLRFQDKLVVSVSASSNTPAGTPGWLQVHFVTEPKQTARAKEAALAEVYRLRDAPVSSEELAKVKKQVVAAYVFGHQSVDSMAESISTGYRDTGDPLFESYYVQRIQKVTVNDIQRVARTYLVPDRLLAATIDPLDVAPPSAASQEKKGEEKFQKHVMPNGLTVLLQHSAAAPLVYMQCLVKGGVLAESDVTNGVADLTAELLTRGTKKYTGDQIAEYFDAVGGDLSAASGQFTVTVTCQVLKDDFRTAFDYFGQVCLQPSFPDDEFADRRQEALLSIGQRKADTFAEAMEFFHDSLPPATVWRRISGGRKETVEKLTVADCRKFHAGFFVPQNMVVTISGDFDPAQALELVKNHFGNLPATAEFKFPGAAGLALTKNIEAHKQTRRPDAAVILLAYPTTDLTQYKDNAALLVLRTILSGYDNGSGWLFHDLRGAGLVYVVQASNRPSLAKGYFLVMAQTRPEQLPNALKRIKENIAKAERGEITPEEFAKARENIINAHARENETLAERAQEAGLDELLGRGYDFGSKFDDRMKAVTLDDVQRVAKQYFTHFVQVTTGPEKPK